MKADTVENCAACRFWKICPSGAGVCRRYPPVPVAEVGSTEAIREEVVREVYSSTEPNWPITNATEWCGEFKAAEEPR